ncbi:hypothetical protein [Paenibacillus pini]|uniref:Uncharacterized protein n=1 Tax=Paenibacillus pini JCM 16418 TaxID=1236976 RepID=W7Z2H1_9BACL|nr:hypothetical protein [Paenibacillus pini]GAF08594.1 hypothetical protein JCM16418_2678 [Paenibacillus pini JCM 16418]
MRFNEQKYKKIMIMVNDEPIGKEIWIDKITYAPVIFNDLTTQSSHQQSEIVTN